MLAKKKREIILLKKKLMISKRKMEILINRNGWWIINLILLISRRTFWKLVVRLIIPYFKIWRQTIYSFQWLEHPLTLFNIWNQWLTQEWDTSKLLKLKRLKHIIDYHNLSLNYNINLFRSLKSKIWKLTTP